LCFIGIFSFYSFVKEWLPNRKLFSIATLLVPLLGFGSFYVLNLKFQNQSLSLASAISNAIPKTYDVMDLMVIGPALANVVPLFLLTLPVLLTFLYLLKKNMSRWAKCFLCAILVAVGFMGHADTSFFIGLVLISYVIITKDTNAKECALGGIIGLLIVPLIDFSAPVQIYVGGSGGTFTTSLLAFLITFALFSLSYAYLFFKNIHLSSLLNFQRFKQSRFKEYFFSFAPLGIMGVYIFAFIVWLYALPTYNAFTSGSFNFTPFFVWPIRFGVIGLLAILCAVLWLPDIVKDKRLLFFASLAIIGVLLEQVTNFWPINGIFPYRFGTLTLLGLVPLAAYSIVKIYTLVVGKKRIVLTILLIPLLVIGMFSSVLFYFGMAQYKPNISDSELAALNFVRQNLGSSNILTFTADSESKLETFAGVNTIQICQRWAYAFLCSQDVSMTLYLLSNSSVKYVYLNSPDWAILNSSNSTLRSLLNYFPVAFQNNDVTIFATMSLSPPSKPSEMSVLNFLNGELGFQQPISDNQALLMSLPSLLKMNYSIDWLPLKEEDSSINFASSSDWNLFEGSAVFSSDSTDSFTNMPSIALHNVQADTNGYFSVSKKGDWNFTNYDSIRLWIKTPAEMIDTVKVVMRGDAGTWLAWFIVNFSPDSWIELNLPLNNASLTSNPKIDISSVKQIDVGFISNPMANCTSFEVSEPSLVKSSLSLEQQKITYLLNGASTLMLTEDPQADLSVMLPWVESGNNVIVLNNPENNTGFFSNYLNLTVDGEKESNDIAFPEQTVNLPAIATSVISSSSVTPLIWYGADNRTTSPFIVIKNIGLGEIMYVNLPSVLLNQDAKTLPLLLDIFQRAISLMKINISTVNAVSNAIPSYGTIEGYLTANGTVEIFTNHLFTSQPLYVSMKSETSDSSLSFNDVAIANLDAYNVNITAQDASLRISASSTSTTYLAALLQNKELGPIKITMDEATFEIVNSSSTTPVSVKDAVLTLNPSNLTIFVRNPSIKTSGETYFKSATIPYSAPYIPLADAVREGITVKGDVEFAISYSANNLMLLDNFWYSGSATKDQTQTQATYELSWLGLFTSPIFFLLLIMIVIVGVVMLSSKLRAKDAESLPSILKIQS
jgi:hypothetical protein